MARRDSASARKKQAGSALLITVLVLVLMGLMGLAALDTVRRDQQVAGFQNRSTVAFFAAEAGLAKAFETLTTAGAPAVPTTALGDGALYPYGQPSFREDPTVAEPIEAIGIGAFPGTSINIGQGGAPTYQIGFWRINVQGDGPGGSVARAEAVAGSLVAN